MNTRATRMSDVDVAARTRHAATAISVEAEQGSSTLG